MPLDGTPVPRALTPAIDIQQRRHRAPFWRGAAGALKLAFWSIAGVLGAALALVPVALERGPRGQAGRALAERSRVRLAPVVASIPAASQADPDAEVDAEPVPAARAAGEAYPG